MTGPLLSEVALREALRSLDEAIVALWASGTRSQGQIGRHVGLDQRSVSRRIARMVRRGAWPFEDRPSRGRSQVPVAASFAAVPIGPQRTRPAGDTPTADSLLSEARAFLASAGSAS
jgi:hypothetical protein